MLVHALETRISARGFATAEIEVMTANERALQLYERLGYTAVWQGTRYDEVLRIDLHKTHLQKNLPK